MLAFPDISGLMSIYLTRVYDAKVSVSSDSDPSFSAVSVTSRDLAASAGGEQEFSTSYVHPEVVLKASTVPSDQASTATLNSSTNATLEVNL